MTSMADNESVAAARGTPTDSWDYLVAREADLNRAREAAEADLAKIRATADHVGRLIDEASDPEEQTNYRRMSEAFNDSALIAAEHVLELRIFHEAMLEQMLHARRRMDESSDGGDRADRRADDAGET